MSKDAFAVENELTRVAGALRALSLLLHSIPGEIEILKADDLGYLVASVAADAERAQRGASALMFAKEGVEASIEQLRAIKTA
ncbi:MAG: hypothetical protein FD175_568 [Beijerinckiaceae bacterium]|nr:MAG: hypothetical protein FD175_568 [Beijerinckiaceae bacterium]